MLLESLEIRPARENRQLSMASVHLDLELLLDYGNDYAIRVSLSTAPGSEEKSCVWWPSGPRLVSAKVLVCCHSNKPH